MSLLFHEDVMFCEGKMKNILKKDVFLTNMEVKSGIIQFMGITKQIGNVFKDSAGFYYEIPISEIARVYKTKVRVIHAAIIETHEGKVYHLVKVDNTSLLGKRYADALVESLNNIKSSTSYCPNCGELVGPTDESCGNCGKKL